MTQPNLRRAEPALGVIAVYSFGASVLADLRNRGVKDVFFVVCGRLKGLPEVVSNVWPQIIVQTRIII